MKFRNSLLETAEKEASHTAWLKQKIDRARTSSRPIDGTLSPSLCATPHALALLIAENMLQNEEAHWARTLDAAPENSAPTPTPAPANLQGRYTVHGLCWSQAHAAHLLTNSAELRIAGLCSARNVYVCGRTLHGKSPAGGAAQALEVTLSVNGIQSKTFTLAARVRQFEAPNCLAFQ